MKHIDAANQLLHKQFPPVVGQSLSFQVTEPPFVQVLHVGGNHWMTVVRVGNTLVKVYVIDSLYRCVSTCVTMQSTASMMNSTTEHLFQIENTKIQQVGSALWSLCIYY